MSDPLPRPPHKVRRDRLGTVHFELERRGRLECDYCVDAALYETLRAHFWDMFLEQQRRGDEPDQFRVGG